MHGVVGTPSHGMSGVGGNHCRGVSGVVGSNRSHGVNNAEDIHPRGVGNGAGRRRFRDEKSDAGTGHSHGGTNVVDGPSHREGKSASVVNHWSGDYCSGAALGYCDAFGMTWLDLI